MSQFFEITIRVRVEIADADPPVSRLVSDIHDQMERYCAPGTAPEVHATELGAPPCRRIDPAQVCTNCGRIRSDHWGPHPPVEGICSDWTSTPQLESHLRSFSDITPQMEYWKERG